MAIDNLIFRSCILSLISTDNLIFRSCIIFLISTATADGAYYTAGTLE